MKKTLLLLVALITATIAFAYDAQINGICYNLNNENKTAEVASTREHKRLEDITIPEKVTYNATEYSVTSIGGSAFSSYSSLSSISIPNSVTSIGEHAFYNCRSLTSITIPNSVTSIGGSAFGKTPWLENQPDGCIYINNSLYVYKGEMPENTHIDVKNGTTQICGSAFHGRSSLASITIPNSVTSIGGSAFSECSSLTSITIPNSVISIGGYAFSKCSSLTSITIPNSVTSIGGNAFSECSSLTSITIGNSVTSIGDAAFAYCTSLASITIPNSVISIGNQTFQGCSSLTSITIPNSVTSINYGIFSNCIRLTSITIGNGVTSIERLAFYKCSSLTSITIPNSVTSIGGHAFSSCSSLTSISIPNSVTSIGGGAFSSCSSLTSITCLGSTPPKASALEADTENCTLKVPYEAYNDYLQHAYWGQFSNIEALDTNLYKKLEILVNDTLFGYVNVSSGYYCVNNNITIHAIPNEGYEFNQWSDGNTENPRTICITSDTTITAEFRVATTPVKNTSDNQTNIYTTNNTLHIEGATDDYHILDTAGRLIYSGNATSLTLPRGIYLITINGEVEKIVL